MADRDTFEHNRARPDPDSIFNGDRLGDELPRGQFVLVRVHDDDVPRDFAVSADRNLPRGDEFCAAVQVCAVPNSDRCAQPTFDADASVERAVLDLNMTKIVYGRERDPTDNDHDASALESTPQPQTQKVGQDASFHQPPTRVGNTARRDHPDWSGV
jgi:hypothetical protein